MVEYQRKYPNSLQTRLNHISIDLWFFISYNQLMKKPTLKKLKDKLWELCKKIIREKYQDKNGNWICFTCGKLITSKQDAHTGHFIPKSVCGAFLKYDLRNLRVQCIACNIWRGGNGAIFYRNMVETEGQEYVNALFLDKQKIVKESDHILQLLTEYENILNEL